MEDVDGRISTYKANIRRLHDKFMEKGAINTEAAVMRLEEKFDGMADAVAERIAKVFASVSSKLEAQLSSHFRSLSIELSCVPPNHPPSPDLEQAAAKPYQQPAPDQQLPLPNDMHVNSFSHDVYAGSPPHLYRPHPTFPQPQISPVSPGSYDSPNPHPHVNVWRSLWGSSD